MRQHEQGVSMVGFLVTVVILAVLLVGGVYAVRHTGWFDFGSAKDTSSESQKSPSQDKNSTKPQPDTKSTPERSATPQDEPSTNEKHSAADSTNSEDKTSDSSNSTSQGAPETSGTEATTPSSTEPSAGSNLPHTGPADTFVSLLGAVLLTGATSAFIISKREPRVSL